MKFTSFQNSFFEFALLIGGVACIISLNHKGMYLIAGEDKGRGIRFSVFEEDRGNRFRRFGKAECGRKVLDRCGEVDSDMRVVAIGFEGSQ